MLGMMRSGESHGIRLGLPGMVMAALLILAGPFLSVPADAQVPTLPVPGLSAPGVVGPATASPALPSDPAQVDAFVARLNDAAARALLVERLKAAAPTDAEAPTPTALGAVARGIVMVRDVGGAAVGRMAAFRDGLADIEAQGHRVLLLMSDLRGWPAVRDSLAINAAILLATILAVAVASSAIRRLVGGGLAGVGNVLAMAADGARVVGAFVLANLMILGAYTREDPLRELPTALVLWGALTYAVHRIATHVGSPHRTAYTLAAACGLAGVLGQGVLQIYGLNEALSTLFLALAGSTAFCVMLPLSAALFPRPPFGTGLPAGKSWPLALSALNAVWLIWLINVLAGRGECASAAVLGGAALAGLSHLSGPAFLAGLDGGSARNGIRLARWALMVIAAAAAAQALGVDLIGFQATAAGRRLIGGAVDSSLIVGLALIGWTALRRWIDRKISIDSDDTGASMLALSEGEGGTAKVGTRAQTLLPLLRSVVAIATIVIVGLMVLSSFGINITPLLAGAGIVGIAVGFGAQSLVRDIFSGIFFLIDDAFRVGEYIEFGEIRGEVERISIRSLTLRHHRGAIHTVPFGEIRSITNYNRDWVIMKLRFTLRYDTDVNLVKKIVKTIGAAMMADAEHGPNLLEAPKSQGILEFAESGIILRVKFKCKPREQFVLRRVLNERMMAEFAKAGVRFAFPTVMVERGEESEGDEQAAAQSVLTAARLPAKLT